MALISSRVLDHVVNTRYKYDLIDIYVMECHQDNSMQVNNPLVAEYNERCAKAVVEHALVDVCICLNDQEIS